MTPLAPPPSAGRAPGARQRVSGRHRGPPASPRPPCRAATRLSARATSPPGGDQRNAAAWLYRDPGQEGHRPAPLRRRHPRGRPCRPAPGARDHRHLGVRADPVRGQADGHRRSRRRHHLPRHPPPVARAPGRGPPSADHVCPGRARSWPVRGGAPSPAREMTRSARASSTPITRRRRTKRAPSGVRKRGVHGCGGCSWCSAAPWRRLSETPDPRVTAGPVGVSLMAFSLLRTSSET